jgi:hypothetical protein
MLLVSLGNNAETNGSVPSRAPAYASKAPQGPFQHACHHPQGIYDKTDDHQLQN